MTRFRTNEWLDEDFDPQGAGKSGGQAGKLHRARAEALTDHVVTDEILAHAEDPEAQAGSFNPTFSSSRYERFWILTYLGPFYDRRLIADVLRKVKGGKEATVYCCRGGGAAAYDLIAAKVYRPRQFRNLRNDALYRQGREVLGARGQPVRDRRALRAIEARTRKGKEMEHVSWLAHEYVSLQALHAAGVKVPEPIAFANNTVLMEYFGDLKHPAPTLHGVALERGSARQLFDSLIADVETMLSHGRVHADLSAFNVLYWQGDYRIIDFPQSVDPAEHSAAFPLFQRDVVRLCQYFSRYGILADGAALARSIWERQITEL